MRGMIYTSGMKEEEEKAVEVWKGSGKTGEMERDSGAGSVPRGFTRSLNRKAK